MAVIDDCVIWKFFSEAPKKIRAFIEVNSKLTRQIKTSKVRYKKWRFFIKSKLKDIKVPFWVRSKWAANAISDILCSASSWCWKSVFVTYHASSVIEKTEEKINLEHQITA